MTRASGIELIAPQHRNPLHTTTYGTGQLIRSAVEHGATEILAGVGGSATVGISGDYPPSSIDEEMLQFIAGDFVARVETIESVVIQDELTIFTIGEYPAVQVTAFDGETSDSYAFMAFGLNDELIAIITVIGQTDDVRILEGTILAIADSMTVK